jgi:hypothetical protein
VEPLLLANPWGAVSDLDGAKRHPNTRQQVVEPKNSKATKTAMGPSGSTDGPFSSITQDAKTWHRLVWLSKMVKLTVEDVSVEVTSVVRARPKPPGEAVAAAMAAAGSAPTFACMSGGFQSFTVAATHVVHPRQVLSLDVNLKGLWARGVAKRTVGASA